jgi:hypothetical protein
LSKVSFEVVEPIFLERANHPQPTFRTSLAIPKKHIGR